MINHFKLTKDCYEKLLSFFGYGNFPIAKILILGNEEGLGGYPIVPNLIARCNDFGKNNTNNYVYLLNNNWKNGFYENTVPNSRNKIEKYCPTLAKKSGHSNFLEIVARICLAYDNQLYTRSSEWFKMLGVDAIKKEAIKNYMRQNIFRENCVDRINTVLTDWKPLPRANENTWYPNEYGNIDKKKYLKAFEFAGGTFLDNFSNYANDALNRADIFKNVFNTYPFPLAIGLGGMDIKYKLLQGIFGQSISKVKKSFSNIDYFDCQIKLSHNKKVLLLPFPDTRKFGNKQNILNFYNHIYDKEIVTVI